MFCVFYFFLTWVKINTYLKINDADGDGMYSKVTKVTAFGNAALTQYSKGLGPNSHCLLGCGIC